MKALPKRLPNAKRALKGLDRRHLMQLWDRVVFRAGAAESEVEQMK
jgi:hypothetical protein